MVSPRRFRGCVPVRTHNYETSYELERSEYGAVAQDQGSPNDSAGQQEHMVVVVLTWDRTGANKVIRKNNMLEAV